MPDIQFDEFPAICAGHRFLLPSRAQGHLKDSAVFLDGNDKVESKSALHITLEIKELLQACSKPGAIFSQIFQAVDHDRSWLGGVCRRRGRGGHEKLAISKRGQGDIKYGRVVNCQTQDHADQEELVRRFETVGVEVAKLTVLVVDEQTLVCVSGLSLLLILSVRRTYRDPD